MPLAPDLLVADGVVGHRAAGGGEEVDVLVIHPDRVDHHRPRGEDPGIVDVAYERFPVLLLAEDPLELRFEDMDVVGDRVPLAQARQDLQVLRGDTLGRRARDGGAEPPVAGAVPVLDEPGVEVGQLFGRLPGRLRHAAADALRQDVVQERVLLVLDHVGLIDGDDGAHAAVDISAHQAVDGFLGRARVVEGVIVNGGHAELQHLHRAQHGPHVIEMRRGRLVAEGRHFVEHEDLERGVVGRALEEIAGGVDVAVDEARHGEEVVGRDDSQVLRLVRDVEIRTDPGDPAAADEDVRPRKFRVVVVHRENAGVSNQD